jgi:hypothetical protein
MLSQADRLGSAWADQGIPGLAEPPQPILPGNGRPLPERPSVIGNAMQSISSAADHKKDNWSSFGN